VAKACEAKKLSTRMNVIAIPETEETVPARTTGSYTGHKFSRAVRRSGYCRYSHVEAMDRMDRKRDWIILQIHDALVVETDEDAWEEVAALVQDCMTCTMELNGYKCLFPSEAKIGRSWDTV